MADLKQLFKTAVASSMDLRGKPAVLGKIDGTLYWSSSRRDMVWARVGESSSFQEMVVQCTKVTPQYDMPVRVDLVNGIMSVVAVDEKRYLEFSGNRPGGNVGAHAWLHGRLGPDPLYVTGLQYLPLLVVPSNPAALTVTVEQGAYRWGGTYKIFERATSGSLSSYVPGSSAVKHFVIICLDRVNNTIVIVDGDDVTGGGDALFGTITLTPDEVEAITIDNTYLPLAAILLYNGQTEVRAADIVMDLRTWGGEDFVGAAGIPEPIDDGETYGRMTDTGVSSWVVVTPEAPTDGYMYARASSGWVSTGIFSGQITVGDGAQAQALTVNGDAGWTRDLRFSSGVSPRWIVRTTDTAESGSNAGSNFEILARADNGTALFTPLAITRSTGLVTLANGVVINGGAVFNESGADVDHRLEGTTDPNLTYWDAGNNNIGIGTPTPAAAAKLHVVGNTYFERSLASLSTLNRFYNPDMTDGNGIVLNFDTDTTGTGATVQQQMAQIAVQFDTHNHTTRSARILFRPTVGGSFKNPAVGIANGMVIGTPTGGYKGDGTINAQNGVYDNNTLLTDHIFDLHYDGRMRPADKERFPDARLWNIEETAVFTKQNRHLPTMPGRLQWETEGGNSLGRMITALWETVEQQQLQIFDLNNRLKAVTNG